MKKIIVMMVAVILAFASVSAMATGMGVQVIGGSSFEAQPVSLDDMQLESAAEIDGWGTITLTECKIEDVLHQYKQGKTTVEGNWNRFESGVEADYLILKANILNTTNAPKDYLKDCTVKVVFNDDAEFAGWSWQYNWDNKTKDYDWDALNGIQNKEFVIDAADQFEISGWYEGHYCFGCTLPNAVVNGSAPLRIEITIGGNELTYNIRK